jgi:hypothetical protein
VKLTLQDNGALGSLVTGVIQPLPAPQGQFPEYVSGFYRVDEWERGAPFQYLQFVVIVRGGDFGDSFPVHEVRFPLAGIDHDPFVLSNARFLYLSRAQPQMGQWVYFGYPVGKAFEKLLGHRPATWDSVELFIEARFDGRAEADGPAKAVVYYDDLYAGPQLGDPNRPD